MPVADTPVTWMPFPALPEMTLRAALTAPPTRVFFALPVTSTPPLALATTVSPSCASPITLPAMTVPVVLLPVT